MQAAISAGYSENCAHVIASENLKKPNIIAEVNRLKGNLEEVLNLSKGRVLAEHMKLAFSSISHMHESWVERKEFELLTEEQKSCIESIETKQETRETEFGPITTEWVKIHLYDKQKALDAISKLMGYEAPRLSSVHSDVNVTGVREQIKALFLEDSEIAEVDK